MMAKNQTAKNDPASTAAAPNADEVTTSALVQAAPQSSTALTSSGTMAMGEGMDDTLASDLIVPRVHIVQPGADEVELAGATKGTFRDNLGVERTELHVALLVARKGQVRWGDFGSKDRHPLCKSGDALAPSPEIERPYASVCNKVQKGRLVPVCPEACWQTIGGERKPPRCSFLYAVVFWCLDTDTPFLQRFSRTGLPAVKMLLTRVWQMREAIYGVEARIGLVLKTDPKAYYAPVVRDAARIEDEDLRAQLRAAWQSAGAFEFDASDFGDEEAEAETTAANADSGEVPF
jgi:hypothetical protein